MQTTWNETMAKMEQQHRSSKRFFTIFLVLALVTVFSVTWQLHQTGITKTADYACGLEEHVHSTDCYSLNLICGQEETPAVAGHVHGEECYTEESILTCTLEESDAEDGHKHTADCYTSEQVLTCTQQETEAVAGHTHTDACYEQQLICDKTEHQHSVDCMSNETADVETRSDWEATLPKSLSGVWADDLLKVAQSQIGYQESTRNFVMSEDGTKMGYTRYGAWYGSEYSHWCAMYVAFCLHYAGIPTDTVPVNAGCQAWIVSLKEAGLYRDTSYTPVPGDVVFFDYEQDGHSDHVGIVEAVTDDSISTIEGNAADQVLRKTYSRGDATICGYLQLPENPNAPAAEEQANTKTEYTYEDDSIAVTATLEDADAIPDEAQFVVTPITTATAGYNLDAYLDAFNEAAETDQTYSAENTLLYDVAFLVDGVEYQPEAGSVTLNFNFKQNQLETLAADGNVSVYHLPLAAEVRDSVDTTAEATDITAEDITVEPVATDLTAEESTSFSLDNFSLVLFASDGTATEVLTPGTTRTYKDILNYAVLYGITANTVKKDAHMDSNFATKNLQSPGGGNVTAGAYSGNGARNGGQYIIANVESGSLAIDGSNFVVRTTQEIKDANKITLTGGTFVADTQANMEAAVDSMMSYVKSVSEAMYAEPSAYLRTYGTYWNGSANVEGWYVDQNNAVLDISSLPDGTYYVNGDDLMSLNDFKIKKKSTQTIVFNLSGTEVTVKRYNIMHTDTGDTSYKQTATSDSSIAPYASTVIFNMPNATKLNFAEATAGVFLAPNADIGGYGGTCSGWVVCNYFTNPGGEWHCVYADMPTQSELVEQPITPTEPTEPTVVPAEISLVSDVTVDEDTPTSEETFRFELMSWNEETSTWETVETEENSSSNIPGRTFTFSSPGRYYFKMVQIPNTLGDDYEYDDTEYVVEVTVTEETVDNVTTLSASRRYFRAATVAAVQSGEAEESSTLHFNNTTKEPAEFELPHTGGTGILPYTIAGLFFMGGSVYLVKRQKQFH